MSLTEINKREKEFHNKLQSKTKGRFENVFYRALHNMYEDFNKYIEAKALKKIVLDYGCGVGSVTEKIAKLNPLKLYGIDISDVSINKAVKNAKDQGLKVNYLVDNCESTQFESNTFDLIFGSGILHHLNLQIAIKEINRILKKDGEMVFLEPLGTNPIINFYRKLTPNSRSIDEHPFLEKDFDFLSSLFNSVEVRYYGFLTLVFFLFYKNPKDSVIFKVLAKLDNYLFKIKYLNKLAWSVMIIAKKN